MNLESYLIPVLGIVALLFIGLAFFMYRVYHSVKDLHNSFAKLGYITREDAKKYFDEASSKAVEMYSRFYQQNQNMLEEGVRKVLSESGYIMGDSIAKAQKEASEIVLKAHHDARAILEDAKHGAKKQTEQSLDYAVGAIDWSLSQYLKEDFKLAEHERIIKKMLEVYLDEHSRD